MSASRFLGTLSLASLFAMLVLVSATAQTTMQFVDRGATGEIDLGVPGRGLSVIDYDLDGWPDIVMFRSNGALSLWHNVADPMRPGERTFVDVSAGSGLENYFGAHEGILVADYDNDGDPDFAVTRGALFRNDGGGTFTDVTFVSGLTFPGFRGGGAWADYDLDGHLDIAFALNLGNHIALNRNLGNGTFADVTGIIQYTAPNDFIDAYSIHWFDHDDDGWPDLYLVARRNSGPQGILLRNQDDGMGGREFVDVAVAAGVDDIGVFPMGIATADWDGDGDFDIGTTDASVGTFFENLGGGNYQATSQISTYFAWGIEFFDADLDGDLELYTAGNFGSGLAPIADRLFENTGGGTFVPAQAALAAGAYSSQYSVLVDFDNDGLQDIITQSPQMITNVYENISTTTNHWFGVKLVGGGDVNLDAVGAIVRMTAGGVTQIRHVSSGSSMNATEDLRLHFGLGTTNSVDQVEVVWPRAGSIASRTEVFTGPFAADAVVTLTPSDPTWSDLGFALAGSNGEPKLTGTGTLDVGTPFIVDLEDAIANAPAVLVIATAPIHLPFAGGTLVPSPSAPVGQFMVYTSNTQGEVTITGNWPTGVPAGEQFWIQYWIGDAAGPFGLSSSNAVLVTTP